MKLHPLYKKLLLLLVVFGPFFWLVFSTDGQRRVDLVLLSLFDDADSMNVAFGKLRGDATERDLRGSFPTLAFACEDRPNEFGDRLCTAPITAFNGAPARYVVAYFRNGGLAALKLGYREPYHRYVTREIGLELGSPEVDAGRRLLRWSAPGGSVLLPDEAPASAEQAAVMWLAQAR